MRQKVKMKINDARTVLVAEDRAWRLTVPSHVHPNQSAVGITKAYLINTTIMEVQGDRTFFCSATRALRTPYAMEDSYNVSYAAIVMRAC